MSRRSPTIMLASLVLVLALVALGASEQPKSNADSFSELHRAEVADATDAEVVMGLIERTGESTTPKHYHPGGEFGFVLDGVVSVETERKPRTTLRAGESFYQPPGEWHVISTGVSGAKTVVFRVLQKGQPMVVTVN